MVYNRQTVVLSPLCVTTSLMLKISRKRRQLTIKTHYHCYLLFVLHPLPRWVEWVQVPNLTTFWKKVRCPPSTWISFTESAGQCLRILNWQYHFSPPDPEKLLGIYIFVVAIGILICNNLFQCPNSCCGPSLPHRHHHGPAAWGFSPAKVVSCNPGTLRRLRSPYYRLCTNRHTLCGHSVFCITSLMTSSFWNMKSNNFGIVEWLIPPSTGTSRIYLNRNVGNNPIAASTADWPRNLPSVTTIDSYELLRLFSSRNSQETI